MNKQTKVLNLLCVAVSLMGILMLFFPILTYMWEGWSGAIYSYVDTGFSLLSFSSDGIGDKYIIALGLLSWAQLITGIIVSSITIISFVKFKNVSNYKLFIVIWVSALLYLIEGIVASSISTSMGSIASTSAWIPFGIITTLSILIIVFLDKYKSVSNTAEVNYQQAATQLQEGDSIFTVNGEVKILKVYDNYLTMETKVNARAILTNNLFGGVKKIFYKNILSVQFKESSNFILGYLQFETANSSTKDNFNSENSVTFDHRKVPNEYAKQVADFIEDKIANGTTPNVVAQATSAADELLKFKNLLDLGVISQEDFDKKKNELLK